MQLLVPTEDIARQHYMEHDGKLFYPGLVKFLTSGPVVSPRLLVSTEAVKSQCFPDIFQKNLDECMQLHFSIVTAECMSNTIEELGHKVLLTDQDSDACLIEEGREADPQAGSGLMLAPWCYRPIQVSFCKHA